MASLNSVHQDAQKLSKDLQEIRFRNQLTRPEQVALKLAEAHAEAVVSLAFVLGNAREPGG